MHMHCNIDGFGIYNNTSHITIHWMLLSSQHEEYFMLETLEISDWVIECTIMQWILTASGSK